MTSITIGDKTVTAISTDDPVAADINDTPGSQTMDSNLSIVSLATLKCMDAIAAGTDKFFLAAYP